FLGAVEAELVVGRALARHRVAPPGPDRDAERAAGQRAADRVLPEGAQLVAAGAVLVGRGHREQGDGGDRARDRDDAAPALHPLAGVARALALLVGVGVAGQPVVVLLVDLLVALVQLPLEVLGGHRLVGVVDGLAGVARLVGGDRAAGLDLTLVLVRAGVGVEAEQGAGGLGAGGGGVGGGGGREGGGGGGGGGRRREHG